MKTDAAKRKNLISAAQAAARFACLVVALLLAQTSVWGFGISQELASSHFAELVPSSVEGNAVAIEYDASDCAVAAKTPTYVQMEFPFARGASIQTPGVTTAGETFVRVGAAPQNLKFGSTSLSGAQPGTYAFPEATFNSIGQSPAALKNFGDLPGAAPQYFRTLSPPAGTPIQRGIVPGGEFGGVGGVPEVIFPKGF